MRWMNQLALGMLMAGFAGCGNNSDSTSQETDTLLYVANSGDNSISVVDLEALSVKETIPLGVSPRTVRLHPLRASFYITQPGTSSVLKLLQKDKRVLANIQLASGSVPNDLLFSQDSSLAYVSLGNAQKVAVLRLSEDRLLQELPVGRRPSALGLSTLGGDNRLFVVNEQDASVTVIELLTNSITKTIPIGTRPRSITFKSAAIAYIADAAAGKALALKLDSSLAPDPNSDITLGSSPEQVGMIPNTNTLLALNAGDSSFLIIDTDKPETRTSLQAGPGASHFEVSTGGTLAYIVNTGGNSVTIVDLETKTIRGTVPVGKAPTGLAPF